MWFSGRTAFMKITRMHSSRMRTVLCSDRHGGVSAWRVSAQGGVHLPPVDRMTDTCENITFPQLLLRTVTILWSFSSWKLPRPSRDDPLIFNFAKKVVWAYIVNSFTQLCEDVWRPSRIESECVLGEAMDFLFPDRNCNPFSSGSTGKLLRHIKFHLLQTSYSRQCRKLLHKREL